MTEWKYAAGVSWGLDGDRRAAPDPVMHSLFCFCFRALTPVSPAEEWEGQLECGLMERIKGVSACVKG